jgi:hypothetical protein
VSPRRPARRGPHAWPAAPPAAVLAAVLAAGCSAGPTPASAGSPATTRPAATSGARAAAAPAATAPARGTPDAAVPSAPPAGVTWQVWRTIALPYSAAGPAWVDGDAAGGFAHTPTGALLGAVHATSRKAAAGDAGWPGVARALLAPGAGRDAWIATRSRVRHPDAPQPGTFAQVAGFQFVSWTDTDAVVQLVSRNPDTSYGVVALHVTWLDGDWRLVLAADGGDAASKQRTTSLAGFVAWGGV